MGLLRRKSFRGEESKMEAVHKECEERDDREIWVLVKLALSVGTIDGMK